MEPRNSAIVTDLEEGIRGQCKFLKDSEISLFVFCYDINDYRAIISTGKTGDIVECKGDSESRPTYTAYIRRNDHGVARRTMPLLVSKWTVLRSWGRTLNIKARPNTFLFSSLFRRNMSLKHSEFVGSLDCGTTYGSPLHIILESVV